MQSVQLQNSFLKFAFSPIWRTSSKYSTKQHAFAQFCFKQMSKI